MQRVTNAIKSNKNSEEYYRGYGHAIDDIINKLKQK